MRTWFITGVSSGFGRAIANAALSAGDKLVGTDDPPAHLLLGSPALSLLEEKLAAQRAELGAWKSLTLSTDLATRAIRLIAGELQ